MATLLKHDRTRRKSSQPSKLLANGLAKTALISTSGRAATNRVHLVDGEIDRLAAPESGTRSYYHDDAVHGLTVAVSRGGKRLFVLYRHLDGKPERITLGVCSEMTVKQARIAAMKMIADAASGKNAADERRALRDEATLDDLFKTFLDLYVRPNLRSKTLRNYQSIFNSHLHGWRLRKLSTIKRMEIIALHAHVGRTSGKYAANRVSELLCTMFNRARKDWEWTGQNPAVGIAFKEHSRERFLDADELPRFFRSLEAELNGTIRDYILVSLLTGARRSNVQAMEWTEINLRTATWTIPAAKAKADKALQIVLDPVIEILQRRRVELQSASRTKSSPWVFPGPGKTGHLVEPKSAWKRILTRAGLSDLRLHDLRRTLGSWQAALGTSLPIIGKSLGHSSLESTAVYSRMNLTPVRDSVNRATSAMLLAAKQPLTLQAGDSSTDTDSRSSRPSVSPASTR